MGLCSSSCENLENSDVLFVLTEEAGLEALSGGRWGQN